MKPEPTVCDIAAGRRCEPCEGGTPPTTEAQARKELETLPGWALNENGIEKIFQFKNYYQTMAFVNALAWVAHQEDHHPDLQVGYKTCHVRYTTHAIGGLSANDFHCARRLDALLAPED